MVFFIEIIFKTAIDISRNQGYEKITQFLTKLEK